MLSVRFYTTDSDKRKHTLTVEQHDQDPTKLVVCTSNEIAEVNAQDLLNAIQFLVGGSR